MPDSQRLLELALMGLEAERAKVDDEIIQIRSQLNGRTTAVSRPHTINATEAKKPRRMSAAARKRISESMKRRWAVRHKPAAQAVKSQPGGLTADGRKKLSEMMKARWAAKRKAGKKAA